LRKNLLHISNGDYQEYLTAPGGIGSSEIALNDINGFLKILTLILDYPTIIS
tara:strand:+ start:235 stop:390 length:156 start_codon:yes stop_codon:yes gene_type:complete